MRVFHHPLRRLLAALCLLGLDTVALAGALRLAYWLRFYSGLRFFSPQIPNATFYQAAAGLSLYFTLALIAAQSLYRFDRFHSWDEEFNAVAKSVTLSAIVVLILGFFYREIQLSRQTVVIAWFLGIIFVNSGRLIFRSAIHMVKIRGQLTRPTLIVGQGTMFPVLIEKINQNPGLGLQPIGWLGARGEGAPGVP